MFISLTKLCFEGFFLVSFMCKVHSAVPPGSPGSAQRGSPSSPPSLPLQIPHSQIPEIQIPKFMMWYIYIYYIYMNVECLYMFIHICYVKYIYLYIHTYIYMYVHIYVYRYVFIYIIYIYTCMYVCMCLCM